MKFETKIKRLGIQEEVEQILADCELYNPQSDKVYLQELSKMRKWEIMEVIGNYINHEERYDHDCEEETEWDFDMRFKTFLKTFELEEKDVPHFYKLGLEDSGYCLAYAINDDVILVIEDNN